MISEKEQLAKDLIEHGKSQGMSWDEIEPRLQRALADYDASKTPRGAKADRSFVDKAGDIFAPALSSISKQVGSALGMRGEGSDYGKALSQAEEMSQRLVERAKNETDLEKKKMLLQAARESSQRLGDISGDVLSSGESAMGLQEGENITPYAKQGVAAGLEAGSFLLPTTKEARGLTAATKGLRGVTGAAARIGEQAGVAGVQGAVAGAGEALSEDESLGDVAGESLQRGLRSGIAAGALQGGLEGVGKASRSLKGLSNKSADVYADTLKETIASKKAIRRQGGVDKMVKKANALGLPKTKSGVEKELQKYRPDFEKKVSAALNKSRRASDDVIDAESILGKIRAELRDELDVPETRDEWKAVEAYLDDATKTYGSSKMSAEGANRLRKQLDSKVGDKLFSETKGKEKAIKSFAGYLRNAVKDAVPETKQYFDRYSLLSDLLEVMKKEPTLSLPELMGAFSAGSIGSAFSGPTGIVSGVAGLGTSKALRSPGLKRTVSSVMQKAGSVREVTPQIPEAGRMLLGIDPLDSQGGGGNTYEVPEEKHDVFYKLANRARSISKEDITNDDVAKIAGFLQKRGVSDLYSKEAELLITKAVEALEQNKKRTKEKLSRIETQKQLMDAASLGESHSVGIDTGAFSPEGSPLYK